jgi:hypothetical protein
VSVTVPEYPDLPVEHVLRPRLPWRSGLDLTECGRPLGDWAVITREAFLAKVRRQGRQRAAMTTCMTCWETATRWAAWDEDPVQAVVREAESRWRRNGGRERDRLLRDELLALAALAEAHRAEFDGLLAGLGDTVRLSDARRARRAGSRR